MRELYDRSAPKRAKNLSINSDLLTKIEELDINLSATLEQALARQLAEREALRWSEENRTAIRTYNEFIEEHGCFGDEFREF